MYIQELISLFSVNLLLIISFCIIGSFFVKETSFFSWLFFSQLIGITIVLVVYSIYKTNFKTFNIALIPFIILTIEKRNFITNFKSIIKLIDYKYALYVLLLLGVLFLDCQSIFLKDGCFLVPYIDIVYYSKLIGNLNIGVENLNLSYRYGIGSNAAFAYHYFDIWLGSFVNEFLNSNHLITYLLIVRVYLLFLSASALLAISETFGLRKILLFLSPLLIAVKPFVICVSPIQLDFLSDASIFFSNAYDQGKLLPIIPFLTFAIISFNRKKILHGYFGLISCGVIFLSYIPSVVITIITFLILSKHSSLIKDFKLSRSGYTILLINIFCVILLFYYLFFFLGSANTPLQGSATNLNLNALNLTYFSTAINIFLKTLLQCAIACAHLIMLWYLSPKSGSTISTYILLFVLVFSSLLMWSFFNFIPLNSVQLFYNISGICLTFLQLLLYIKIANTLEKNSITTNRNKLLIGFITATWLILSVIESRKIFSNLFSAPKDGNFIQLVTKEFGKSKQNLIAYFSDSTYFKDMHDLSIDFSVIHPEHSLYSNDSHIIFMTIDKLPIWIKIDPQKLHLLTNTSPFFKYLIQNNVFIDLNKTDIQLNYYQNKFIHDKKVNFIICSIGVELNEELKGQFHIFAVDSETGEKYYKRK